MRLSTADEATLLIISLGSSYLLGSSLRPGRGFDERQGRIREGLTGLLGLLSVALDFCWDLGLLRHSSAAVFVFLARHSLRGILIALYSTIILRKSAKPSLVVALSLFVVFNLFAIAHYGLGHFASKAIFVSGNGFLIGLSLTFVCLLVAEQLKVKTSTIQP